MDWLIFGSVNIIVLSIGFLVIARRLRRQFNAQQFLAQVQQEVNTIITELNQTTERNIQLLEDRVAAARDALADLDRRIVMAESEEQKRSRTEGTYTHLRQQRRVIQRSLVEEPAPVLDPPAVPANPPPVEREQPPAAAVGEALKVEAVSSSAARQSLNRAASRENTRAQVVELHRAGLDPSLIAQRCGITPGEAELIISLHGAVDS